MDKSSEINGYHKKHIFILLLISDYPNAQAAHVALCVVRGFLEKNADKVLYFLDR